VRPVRVRWAVSGASVSMLVAVTLFAVMGAAPIRDPEMLPAPRAAPARHVVVAFGDSVPSGAACSCDPFPTIYGSLLSKRIGAPVTVHNYAVSGLDTSGMLAQLDEPKVQWAVRQADVVLVTIGANDFQDHHDDVVERTCGTSAGPDCVSDEVDSMRGRLSKAVSEIRILRGDRPTTILMTGYWNVFEDGAVARRAYGEAGLQASIALTRRINATISAVAVAGGARYVDLLRPFQRRGRDITRLMAPDGDHPDAAGHELIAEALLDAGLPRVS
jgi:lysophospholipase L1-like esterase